MCRMVGAVDAAAVVAAARRMSRGVSPHHEHGTDLRSDGSARLRHFDGWGALYRAKDGSLVCLRGTPPIDRDPSAAALGTAETDSLVVHVRNATRQEQRGTAYTHPVEADVAGRRLYFFHNGFAPGVHRLLGREAAAWDTRDLFEWLAKGYGGEGWEEGLGARLAALPDCTTSANFVVADETRVVVGNWYSQGSPTPRYYRMHRFSGGGAVVIASEPAGEVGPPERWTALENGTVWCSPLPRR
jgi:predicted glutamine amidotransferase